MQDRVTVRLTGPTLLRALEPEAERVVIPFDRVLPGERTIPRRELVALWCRAGVINRGPGNRLNPVRPRVSWVDRVGLAAIAAAVGFALCYYGGFRP